MNNPAAEKAALASQYTPAFNELLQKAGVSLAVSTYQAGRLILLRASETLNTHFIAIEKPMGIAMSGSRLSVGTGYQVWDYFNMSDVAPKIHPAGQHDACLIPRRLHITGDIDIHEMAFDKNNELWLLNTRMSALCTLDLEHSIVPRWSPPFISAYDLSDRCHLNGLAMKQGQPAWATALGETDTPAGWRKNKASGGILIDIKKNRIICRNLSMPHSPRWYHGKLYLLESGAGRILTVNPSDGATETVAEVPGFCRGISFIGPYALVGLSQVRETAVFAGLPLTMRWPERKCGIWIVDLRDGSIPGWLAFESGVQEIFAVQVLPWKFPALLDLSDPFVRSSYSLPDQALKKVAETDPVENEISTATLLRRDGKLKEAVSRFRAVLEEKPDHSRALYMLGDTLASLGKYKEAVAALDKLLQTEPTDANAALLAGNCLQRMTKPEKAIDYYNRALESDNAFAAAHYGLGQAMMRLGQYDKGAHEYKWRRELGNFAAFHSSKPHWKGTALGAGTLLVHTEQCVNDAILLARFLPDAATLCGKLIVAAPEPLRAIMGAIKGVSKAEIPQQVMENEFDEYCSVLDLMDLMDISKSFPKGTSSFSEYITVPTGTLVPLLEKNNQIKAGLAWHDSRYMTKSCPLEKLASLIKQNGLHWHSLQPAISNDENKILTRMNITEKGHEILSFAHLAAIIEQLDIVVTVDNTVAHLAGAMGKKCLVMLTEDSHWCWPVNKDISPWYPTLKTFRKPASGTWETVIESVNDELIKYTENK
jgi:uncharacterized protein (TIGR03032 family)